MTIYKVLLEKDIDPDPFKQFSWWFRERLASGIDNPGAASLATATSDGKVSVRMILLKSYDERGFVFFTNYNSRKAFHLSVNNKAALLFYWPESGRQIRIEGMTIKLTGKESAEYFQTRTRESRIAAWASDQSSVIPDRQYLEKRYDSFRRSFNGKEVNKPEFWGGFRLVPDWFEFWQERDFRLHDRLSYTKKENRWIIERLAP